MERSEVERIIEAMDKQFMKPAVFGPCDWFEFERPLCGPWFVPADDADLSHETDCRRFGDGESITITAHRGKYGARLSAPGYMDATEWTIFDSPEEAEEYLAETYGDDIDLDDDSDMPDPDDGFYPAADELGS